MIIQSLTIRPLPTQSVLIEPEGRVISEGKNVEINLYSDGKVIRDIPRLSGLEIVHSEKAVQVYLSGEYFNYNFRCIK